MIRRGRGRFADTGWISLMLGAGAALAGCSTQNPPAPEPGVTDVLMQNIAFQPNEVRIKAGETVRWTNMDLAPHTATSGSPGDADAGAIWDSGDLQIGQSFTRTFDEAGEFVYFCAVHPLTMRDAKVIVEP